ncbi:MAG: hypothetical protein F6K56_03115 [Moorea sp. SIO3G5]|nr:hypothetical protein [Moorena sp. SIO3G5]
MARFRITEHSKQLAKSRNYQVKEVMDTETADTYSLFLSQDGQSATTIKNHNKGGDLPEVVELEYRRI